MKGRHAGTWVAVWSVAAGLGAGLPAGAATEGASCPPEEQAVLAAYAECATFRREAGEAKAARTLEARAAKLLEACDTQTSVFIGADPARELTECAEALAAAGRLEAARRIEPAAHAYRTEQMLRLVMHGGKVLDPARYMGRPKDYDRQRPGLNPPEERMTTPEFSVGKPHGGGWRLVSGGGFPIVFSKDAAWLGTRPLPGQTIVVAVALKDATAVAPATAADFPDAFAEMSRDSISGRFQLRSLTTAHRGDPHEACTDFELLMEERDNPAFPGTVLEIWNRGFACLEPASRFVLEAYLSERRPQGAPSALDEAIRGEAEAFLRDIEVQARRDPSPGSPE